MLQIKVKRKELLKVLDCLKVVYKDARKDKYKGVSMKLEGNALKLSAEDSNIILGVCSIDCEVLSGEGCIEIPTIKILDIEKVLKKIGEEEVILECKECSEVLRVSTKEKKQTIEIKGDIGVDYTGSSLLEEDKDPVSIELKKEVMSELVEKVEYARLDKGLGVGGDKAKLEGLLLGVEGNKLRLAGTDGYRLAVQEVELEGVDVKDKKQVYINRVIIECVKKVLKKIVKKGGKIELCVGRKITRVEVEIGGMSVELRGRNLEGKVLEYENFFEREREKGCQKKIELSTKEYLSSVEFLMMNEYDYKRPVITEIEGKKMRNYIKGNEEVVGETELELKGSNVEELFQIGYNGKYLTECLKVLKGEEVSINYTDEMGGIVITTEEDKGFRYLLLPVVIKSY